MCGIFGVWNLDRRPVSLDDVLRATRLLRHRGPDDSGYWLENTYTGRHTPCADQDTDVRLGLSWVEQFATDPYDLAFGFRRLAIQDTTPAGHQPMSSADDRFVIVFNGEIYNFLELRAELREQGSEFRTGTDTEVILAAYSRWGVDCLKRFNGMWAFAIWERRSQRLFLARDRFGIKPLYYTFDGNRFSFASEIKALVGRHGICFVPDDTAVYRYLMGGVLPSPQQGSTFFQHVHALPPASWITVGPDAVETNRYWQVPLPSNGHAGKSVEEAVDRYRALFTDAVRLRLRADVPIGTCLSGGIDSSSIVCVIGRLMSEEGINLKQIGQHQKTFSAIYDSSGRYNERVHIENVLRSTGAEGNFTHPTAERLQADLERLVWHQDEPFVSTSMFAQWCVMQSVRERGVKVLLDGQGADELLGGYQPFRMFLGDLVRRKQLGRMFTEASAIASTTGRSIWSLWARAMLQEAPDSLGGAVLKQRARRNADWSVLNPDFAHQNHRALVAGPAWADQRTLEANLLDLLQESNLPHLLRYEDRNSMAFGVEARVPYLDYRLVTMSFNEAAPWRIHRGWTKWILRQSMDGIVPDDVIWRRDKVGFETPENDWIKRLLDSGPHLFDQTERSRKYLDPAGVRRKAKRWKDTGGDTLPIWRLVNLETWLRVWSAA